MKISILVHNLSANSIGRTYPLAKILEKHYQIEVIGLLPKGKEIYFPYKDEFNYKPIIIDSPQLSVSKIYSNMNKITRQITGNVVYAFKPLLATFGVGLYEKIKTRKKLVLDIEDWDSCAFDNTPLRYKYIYIKDMQQVFSSFLTHYVKFADAVTTGSTFLQNKYFGTIVRTAVDCHHFNPNKFQGDLFKAKHGLSDKRIIMFLGLPQLHKGVDFLAEALHAMNDKNLTLVLFGKNDNLLKLRKKYNNLITLMDRIPFSQVPEYLAGADLIVIPQDDSHYAQAQMPAKLFHSMAMGKPIIASSVSDIPEALKDCGWLVKPNDMNGLIGAIKSALENPTLAAEYGVNARKRCIERYSYETVEKVLLKVFQAI